MAHVFNVSMDPETDRDIIRWLDEQPNRSAAVRAAVRAYMAKEQGATIADVLAAINALPSKLRVVSVEQREEIQEGDEPAAAAANVDGLLDRLDAGDWD